MALKGIRVMEFAGLAPAPYCGMVLADFGATVVRIDKAKERAIAPDCLGNGKASIALNLKHPKGIKIVKKLSKKSDVLIDCYRPGVMERLGIGPEVLMAGNEKLIYARLTGYGQTGPLSKKAGHDINFISMSGVLSMLCHCERGRPQPPLNLVGDFGGGGLMCAMGIVMALYERSHSGRGQLVDCDMTSGSAYLASWLYRSRFLPIWAAPDGTNLLEGSYHAYTVYETKDGQWMSVGALEPQFYINFLAGLRLQLDNLPQSNEEVKKVIGQKFKEKTRDEWCKVFEEIDACVTPVLSIEEASRGAGFVNTSEGCHAPCPAPSLEKTPGTTLAGLPPIEPGQHSTDILTDLEYTQAEIASLLQEGVVDHRSTAKL